MSEINNSSLEIVFATDDLQLLSKQDFINDLASEINHLILINFERLIHLLYRIDVSEVKLKTLLKENPTKDAGKIIATLIIERQLQKIKYKSSSTVANEDDCDEEKW
jgi:hypothetical protein